MQEQTKYDEVVDLCLKNYINIEFLEAGQGSNGLGNINRLEIRPHQKIDEIHQNLLILIERDDVKLRKHWFEATKYAKK